MNIATSATRGGEEWGKKTKNVEMHN